MQIISDRLSEKEGKGVVGGGGGRGGAQKLEYSYSRLRMIISYKYCTIYSPAIMLRLVFSIACQHIR